MLLFQVLAVEAVGAAVAVVAAAAAVEEELSESAESSTRPLLSSYAHTTERS